MGLLYAWFRRKQWEAKVNAGALMGMLAEAFGAKRETMSLGSLAALGFRVEDKRGQ